MVDKVVLAQEINKLLANGLVTYDESSEKNLIDTILSLMASIPPKRKASYGVVSVIALLCKSLHKELHGSTYDVGMRIYRNSTDFRTVSVGLGLISHAGLKNPDKVLPILREAANHELWEVKEFVQMFIRKITKVHKELVQDFLIQLTTSDNPSERRFASEALRPVVENRWIQDEPEYSLKVLRCLFNEAEEFPKVSVGNNLSDLSRKNPELIYRVVEELVALENENSDFIAHRACRNLVKDNPNRVMDLLGTDFYKYKNSIYRRI